MESLGEGRVAFPNLRMAKIVSPPLKKMSKMCGGKVPILLHPSLYKALKFIFPTVVGSILPDG